MHHALLGCAVRCKAREPPGPGPRNLARGSIFGRGSEIGQLNFKILSRFFVILCFSRISGHFHPQPAIRALFNGRLQKIIPSSKRSKSFFQKNLMSKFWPDISIFGDFLNKTHFSALCSKFRFKTAASEKPSGSHSSQFYRTCLQVSVYC